MDNNIFRKKSIERVSSPEQLNDYIRVSNPGIWTVLIAVILLLAGVCVWGVLGHLDTTLDAVAISSDGATTIYIKEADIESVKSGLKVTLDGVEHELTTPSDSPVAVTDDTFTEYAMHVGGLSVGEWVYSVTLPISIENGIYKAVIVIDSVSPMSFVFN